MDNKSQEPWKLTEQQAIAEIKGWKLAEKQLKPGLVTRESLWADFVRKEPTWENRLLNAGTAALQFALSGPDVLDAISFVKHAVATVEGNIRGNLDVAKVVDNGMEIAQDKALEKAQDQAIDMAGFYLTKDTGLHEQSNQKFATKLLSTGLSVTIGLLAGAPTGGLGALVGLGAAFIIWMNDRDRELYHKRAQEIVNGMMEKYLEIRSKAHAKLDAKFRKELVELVLNNARHDWEDDNLKVRYSFIPVKKASAVIYETRAIDIDLLFNELGSESKQTYLKRLSEQDQAEFLWTFRAEISFLLNTRDLPKKALLYTDRDNKQPWKDKNSYENAPTDERFKANIMDDSAFRVQLQDWLEFTAECRRAENEIPGETPVSSVRSFR